MKSFCVRESGRYSQHVSTASSGEALQSLGAALRGALARVRGSDDLYEVTCGVLRHHLGPDVMLSLYEEDAGRVWLRAQRGYAETIHSLPARRRTDLACPARRSRDRDPRRRGLRPPLHRARRDGRGDRRRTVRDRPRARRARAGIVADARAGHRRGSRRCDARRRAGGRGDAGDAMLERPTGARWLSRSFLRLASTRDRDALFELTARLVGEVLDVDCVQAAEGSDELVVVATCHAGRERVLPLPDAADQRARACLAARAVPPARGRPGRRALARRLARGPLRDDRHADARGRRAARLHRRELGRARRDRRRRLRAGRAAGRAGIDRALDAPHARALRARGRHRRAHRPLEPPALLRDVARADRGGARGRVRARARRSRRLQGAERPPRARRGRRCAALGRGGAAARHATRRLRLPRRRRGVRAAAARRPAARTPAPSAGACSARSRRSTSAAGG